MCLTLIQSLTWLNSLSGSKAHIDSLLAHSRVRRWKKISAFYFSLSLLYSKSPPLRTRLGQQKLVYWWHLYKFPFALCPLKRTGWAFLELVRVCAKPWAALWTSLAIVLFTVHWYSKALMLRVSGLKALVLRWILRTCKGIWVWWCRLRLRANETWVQTPSLPN